MARHEVGRKHIPTHFHLTQRFALDKAWRLWYNTSMNGYDFDDTIFRGNSMRRFSIFCTLRLPYLILFTPMLLLAFLLRAVRILDKNRFLHMISLFIAFVPHAEKFAARFWDKNIKRIKPWYFTQRRDDDIIISASPAFLIEEICSRLGVSCIATNLDTHARLHGKHCYGAEKVKMYKAVYGDAPLASYYSDSKSDTPMFKFADKGYFVKGNEVSLIYQNGAPIE